MTYSQTMASENLLARMKAAHEAIKIQCKTSRFLHHVWKYVRVLSL